MVSFQPDNRYPWVVVRLRKELYAISARTVREMVLIRAVTAVPGLEESGRGVMEVRGQSIPLLDLRVLLGMESYAAEIETLIDLLHAREADHVDWLAELEASAAEQRPFRLATDPDECLFGRWYADFSTDNLVLSSLLQRFDAPHRAIHAIAADVDRLVRSGDFEGARLLIERTRSGPLARMQHLFGTARHLLGEEQRETSVIVEDDGGVVAVAVDAVVAVEYLSPRFAPVPGSEDDATAGLVGAAGHRRNDEESLVLLLDPSVLAARSGHGAAA